jgi:hypothetical protein
MMKKFALAGLLGAALASPALAIEHEVVIEHEAGPIAAGYKGSVAIETTQIGTPGVAGRPSSLACKWTAALNVERVAKVGDARQSRRSLTRENVASGSRPGWCEANAKAIDKIVDSRTDSFRTAMLAMVEQDRAAILAEAETVTGNTRGG